MLFLEAYNIGEALLSDVIVESLGGTQRHHSPLVLVSRPKFHAFLEGSLLLGPGIQHSPVHEGCYFTTPQVERRGQFLYIVVSLLPKASMFGCIATTSTSLPELRLLNPKHIWQVGVNIQCCATQPSKGPCTKSNLARHPSQLAPYKINAGGWRFVDGVS